MNIEALLNDEIQLELRNLNGVEEGTEEHKVRIDNVVKLIDRAIEIEKLNLDEDEKKIAREEERKDRIVKNCIAVAGIVIPTVVTIWGTLASFEFEKEGTVTTIMGRGFINKLLPKK